jgi:hypothetical protein
MNRKQNKSLLEKNLTNSVKRLYGKWVTITFTKEGGENDSYVGKLVDAIIQTNEYSQFILNPYVGSKGDKMIIINEESGREAIKYVRSNSLGQIETNLRKECQKVINDYNKLSESERPPAGFKIGQNHQQNQNTK